VLKAGVASSADIAASLGHRQLSGNIRKALPSMVTAGLLEYTIPDKPRSSKQKYRLTERGRKILEDIQ
jgi:ATP-dependent DNA helicase RecG